MRRAYYIALQIMAIMCASCGKKSDSNALFSSDEDIVAQYRDTILRVSDIVRQLPQGLSATDSITLSQAIIDQWIDGFLINDLAGSQIDDMERVDRLTETYRRSLIADSYRRKMRASGVQPIDRKGITDYYRRHRLELKLERPIVKGLFIKIPSSSRYGEGVRKWMREADATAVDELENIGLNETAQFHYFADVWIDWDVISEKIPYRFGNPDQFVETNRDFETEHNGTLYLLHISDYRHSGGLMPEEYATPIIEDRIKNNHLADYERGLLGALRSTAIEKGILKTGNTTK